MAMLEGEDYNSFFNHHIICDIMKTMCDIIICNFESWYDTNRLSWNHAYAYDIIYVLIVLSHYLWYPESQWKWYQIYYVIYDTMHYDSIIWSHCQNASVDIIVKIMTCLYVGMTLKC